MSLTLLSTTARAPAPAPDPAPHALEQLLETHPAIWRGRERATHGRTIASGYAALDAALPGGGWAVGGVTELLVATSGIGELSLLLPALRSVSEAGGWIAFVDPPYRPYGPALVNAGLALERLLVVDAGAAGGDALWAAEQLLRAGTLGALVLWVSRTTAQRQRRLQLAAESGGSWATVYRPFAAGAEHSPVAARLAVAVRDARVELELIKVRGGRTTTVTLDPALFDAAQGSDWPLAADTLTSPRALARAIR